MKAKFSVSWLFVIPWIQASCSVWEERITWNTVLKWIEDFVAILKLWSLFLTLNPYWSTTSRIGKPTLCSFIFLTDLCFFQNPSRFCSSSLTNTCSPFLSSLLYFPSQHLYCTACKVFFTSLTCQLLPLQCYASLGPETLF